jgi:hypothetical protein
VRAAGGELGQRLPMVPGRKIGCCRITPQSRLRRQKVRADRPVRPLRGSCNVWSSSHRCRAEGVEGLPRGRTVVMSRPLQVCVGPQHGRARGSDSPPAARRVRTSLWARSCPAVTWSSSDGRTGPLRLRCALRACHGGLHLSTGAPPGDGFHETGQPQWFTAPRPAHARRTR